jgi:prepilin peptidase dependent protein B
MLNRPRQRRLQGGFSLVELMVGSAVGLLLVSAVVTLYVSSIGSSRNLALAARLNQDMRAAADLVARDLRRASFWDNALTGTTAIGSGSATAVNPYRAVTTPEGETVTQVEYVFSQAAENNAIDAGEQFGFRLTTEGVLEMKTQQGLWKAITNPGVVRIQRFDIAPSETTVPLGDLCPTVCLPGVPNCPTTTVRRFDIEMDGQATADARVTRAMRSTVRIRNDRLEGQCPA